MKEEKLIDWVNNMGFLQQYQLQKLEKEVLRKQNPLQILWLKH